MTTHDQLLAIQKEVSELHMQVILTEHALSEIEQSGTAKEGSVFEGRLARAAAKARVIAKRLTRYEREG